MDHNDLVRELQEELERVGTDAAIPSEDTEEDRERLGEVEGSSMTHLKFEKEELILQGRQLVPEVSEDSSSRTTRRKQVLPSILGRPAGLSDRLEGYSPTSQWLAERHRKVQNRSNDS